MLTRKKLILVVIVIITLSIVAILFIRNNISKNYVKDYNQEVENIRNYPNAYTNNSSADLRLLEEAMNYDDKNYQATILYAQGLQDLRKFDRALTFYQKAIDIYPDSLHGYWYRSQCYASLKKYNKAIIDITTYINLNPEDLEGYFIRARFYSANNNRLSAIKDYDEIINREDYNNPEYSRFAMTLNNKAFSLMELEKYYEALPLLNHAILLQEDEDTFYGSRGELYYALGEFDKLYRDFNNSIKILIKNNYKSQCNDPSSYYYYRGLLHSRFGMTFAAGLDLQRAIKMGSIKAAAALHEIEKSSE